MSDQLIDQAQELAEVAAVADQASAEKSHIAARAAERAAKRAIADHEKRTQSDPTLPGTFAHPGARARSRISSFLPTGVRLQISKRTSVGDTAFVAEYSVDDLAGYANIQSFIADRLLKGAKPPFEWVALEVLPSGQTKAPINVKLDPPEDPMASEVKDAINNLGEKLNGSHQVKQMVEGMKALKELAGDGEQQGGSDVAEFASMGRQMMMMKMMAQIFEPPPPPLPLIPSGPSPEVVALTKSVEALQRTVDKLLEKQSQPQQPSMLDMITVISKLNEPTNKLLFALIDKKSSGSDDFFKHVQQWRAMGGDSELQQLGGLLGAWMDRKDRKQKPPKQIPAETPAQKPAAQAQPAAEPPADESDPPAPPEFVEACAKLETETDHDAIVQLALKAIIAIKNSGNERAQKNLGAHMAQLKAAATKAQAGDGDARARVVRLIDQFIGAAESDGHVTAATRAKVKAAFEAMLDEFIPVLASFE